MLQILYGKHYLLPSILIAFFLSVTGFIFRYVVAGDNLQEPLQTVLISLTTTLYAYIAGVFIKQMHGTYKYSKLAGTYTGYAYKNEEDYSSSDFYEIKSEPQSVATLKYVGDKDFTIMINVTEHPSDDDLTWTGDFSITSENTANIAWWYTNKRLKYSVGLKKAVVKNDMIILFSEDNSIHRREVFIKDRV